MMIRITVDDNGLKSMWKVKKGCCYLVREKVKGGYKIFGKVNYDCNTPKGTRELIFIRDFECKIISE